MPPRSYVNKSIHDARIRHVLSRLPGLKLRDGPILHRPKDSVDLCDALLWPDLAQKLTEQLVTDRLVELLTACYNERDLLYGKNRMDDYVNPWAGNLEPKILCEVGLVIVQAAWAYYKNPDKDECGHEIAMGPPAIAGMRMCHALIIYEWYMVELGISKETLWGSMEGTYAPAMRDNGQRAFYPDGWPARTPVYYLRSAALLPKVKRASLSELHAYTKNPSKGILDAVFYRKSWFLEPVYWEQEIAKLPSPPSPEDIADVPVGEE
ncbi:hypothetical protein B0T17DRAFT_616566 [Bombardia bombarda]|uniref:Uncharacterized protein n=1 Tax=Bombardia bombarda TaxID=252184 RepID=A0AA40CB75_9PEZI|nr:hypothetical protein B0T17DRAFT_616566 [Bombardia bombarda]